MTASFYKPLAIFCMAFFLLNGHLGIAQYDTYQNRGLANNNFNRDVPVVVPIYEYIADNPIRYFYTSQSNIGSGWRQNGIAFRAYKYQEPGTVRIYRYFGKNPWRFAYSTDPNLNTTSKKWTQEGIAFYAYLSPEATTIPIYQHSVQHPLRFLYSANADVGAGWQNDGIAFYALPTQMENPSFNPLVDYNNTNSNLDYFDSNPDYSNSSGDYSDSNYDNSPTNPATVYNNDKQYNDPTLYDRGAYTSNFNNYADYTIHIKTGDAFGAATNAQVDIGMVNEKGETTWINANERIGFNAFQQGAMDTFVLPNANYIGTIVEIKVRMNKTAGFEDDWLLEYIQIQRTNGQLTTANFNQWVK